MRLMDNLNKVHVILYAKKYPIFGGEDWRVTLSLKRPG